MPGKTLRSVFYLWLVFLGVLILVGALAYLRQIDGGLRVTGLSRNLPWGFYIAQFSFLLGLAVAVVMLAPPALSLKSGAGFRKTIMLGEFMSIGAVFAVLLFILADLGQPQRLLNMLLHPSPASPLFWDMTALACCLVFNLSAAWIMLDCERQGATAPVRVKQLVRLSLASVVGCYGLAGCLYAILPGHSFLGTAFAGARFLAAALCSGPALLLLALLLLRRIGSFRPDPEAVRILVKIILWAAVIHLFIYGLEFISVLNGMLPQHSHPLLACIFLTGKNAAAGIVVSLAAALGLLGCLAFLFVVLSRVRNSDASLSFALCCLLCYIWFDSNSGFFYGVDAFGGMNTYAPSLSEICVGLGVYGCGALLVTLFWRAALKGD
ncbi:MAG: polysulfide reductase NrfD [Desulfovibrio sp.]|nr:polysulfide reductase NrfD [Desulfovibrio sp.]